MKQPFRRHETEGALSSLGAEKLPSGEEPSASFAVVVFQKVTPSARHNDTEGATVPSPEALAGGLSPATFLNVKLLAKIEVPHIHIMQHHSRQSASGHGKQLRVDI